MRALRIACLLFFSSVISFAQTSPQPSHPAPAASKTPADTAEPAPPPGPSDANSLAEGAPVIPADLLQIVKRQFGPSFKVALQRSNNRRYLNQSEHVQEWSPLLVGDLDGDGVEDAVIVARVRNVFSGQIPFKYAVIDPYFAAFGYGNPKVTAALASERPEGDYVVLVIQGAGPEGWRNPVPKAKTVMVNLPFNTINIAPMNIGKKGKPEKQISVIVLEEDGTNKSSLVVWNGKTYKWSDMGGPGE
jgi:hypothetical protein